MQNIKSFMARWLKRTAFVFAFCVGILATHYAYYYGPQKYYSLKAKAAEWLIGKDLMERLVEIDSKGNFVVAKNLDPKLYQQALYVCALRSDDYRVRLGVIRDYVEN